MVLHVDTTIGISGAGLMDVTGFLTVLGPAGRSVVRKDSRTLLAMGDITPLQPVTRFPLKKSLTSVARMELSKKI